MWKGDGKEEKKKLDASYDKVKGWEVGKRKRPVAPDQGQHRVCETPQNVRLIGGTKYKAIEYRMHVLHTHTHIRALKHSHAFSIW